MADRFPGQIWIGGEIKTPEMLEELSGLVESQGVSDDWGKGSLDAAEVKKLFLEAARSDKDNTVSFVNDEACSGEFEELEEGCRELGVSYVRHSSAKYEYDAEVEWWEPGMKAPASCYASTDGPSPMIPLYELEQVKSVEELAALLAANTPIAFPQVHIPFKTSEEGAT